MKHKHFGDMWIANEAHGLKLEAPEGEWKPNKIEQRIIRDAVDWYLLEYKKQRIIAGINKRRSAP